jgi:hypothetical protein
MSLRSPVSQDDIRRFLQRLGDEFRDPGRIYLVGGTTLVFEGLRRQTVDIDIAYDVTPERQDRFIQVVRRLKDVLDINVEEASPGDFIPLPAGAADRHEYVGRFGQLDVFHFDLYSTALSKIARGREQDFADVTALLNMRRIGWTQLEACYRDILPQIGRKSLRHNPEEFELNFRALTGMWRAAGGQT